MPTSLYMTNKLLEITLRNISWTPPALVYVSLHSADPTNTGTVGEISGGTGPYARKAASFNAATGGAVTLNVINDFTGLPAVGGSGVTHVAIWDVASGTTNCLWYGPLTTSRVIVAGDTLRLTALSVTLT